MSQNNKQSNIRNYRLSTERRDEFLTLFAREAPHIRDSIAKDLPAYNALLGMHGLSFEDYAMQLRAIECGVPLGSASTLVPICPSCGTDHNVGRKEAGIYRCRTCGRTFAANYNSISSGTKCDALTWMKVLRCILDSITISKTCDYCDISETTYYKIRNRLFYAMQLLMDEVKLYGLIEVDNSFIRISYKGMDLRECEFDEDSIFFDDRPKPREARSRGGAYSKIDQNANSVCIFTGIDDRGHVLARFVGVGQTSYRLLQHYIPADKFLPQVPRKDSFLLLSQKNKEPKTKPGEDTLVVADKEQAIKRYISSLNLNFESHVFRKDGVQLKLHNAHQIQRVNALHHRLKVFLQKSNYVSTKYLPGYLVLFEFVENTKASQEAINRLFQILATPNLGKPSSFYREMYTVPNFLLEWIDGSNPLKKIPYNKRVAFYLYDHIRCADEYPDVHITMEQIMRETGYTAPSIRRFYRDLNEAGYREKILRYFGEPSCEQRKKNAKIMSSESKSHKQSTAPDTLNPTVLAIYDEYNRLRELPRGQRPTLDAFLAEKNKQYGTKYTRTNMLMKFKYIQKHTDRPAMTNLNNKGRKAHGDFFPESAFSIRDDFNAIILSYREKGEKPPRVDIIHSLLGEKYTLSPVTVQKYICQANSYDRKKNK